jgi:hypothetical protein
MNLEAKGRSLINDANHGLESKPLLAFAVRYVTAHLALDLVDEKRAEAILTGDDHPPKRVLVKVIGELQGDRR